MNAPRKIVYYKSEDKKIILNKKYFVLIENSLFCPTFTKKILNHFISDMVENSNIELLISNEIILGKNINIFYKIMEYNRIAENSETVYAVNKIFELQNGSFLKNVFKKYLLRENVKCKQIDVYSDVLDSFKKMSSSIDILNTVIKFLMLEDSNYYIVRKENV